MSQELARTILAILMTMTGLNDQMRQQIDQLTVIVQSSVINPPPVNVLVSTAAALQTAIDTVPAGSTIRVAQGRYIGPFILRNRPGDLVTTITTDGFNAPYRISKTAPLAVLCSASIDSPVRTDPGAHHYALVGLEVCDVNGGYTSIALGTNEETTSTQFPCNITIDRVRIAAGLMSQQRRGIQAIGCSIAIINSSITGIKYSGEDSQGIWGNGPGPYTITNNDIEAAGENILFGGADPRVPLLVPTDITVTGNWLHKPTAWRGSSYTVKNLFELKNARQVRASGNIFENVWVNGQTGYAVLFTPRNQSGTCPWCVVEDVTFENNIVRHAAGAVNILGMDDEHPSKQTNNLRVQQNAFLDIGTAWGASAYVFMIGAGPTAITFDHNTVRSTGARGVISAYGTPTTAFVYTADMALNETYGIFGDGVGSGTPAITKYFPGGILTGNVLAGASSGSYPANFGSFPTVAAYNAAFTTPTGAVQTATSPWRDKGVAASSLPNEAVVVSGHP